MISIVLGLLIAGWLMAAMFSMQNHNVEEQAQPVQVQKQPKVAKSAAAAAPRFEEGVPAFGLK